MAIKLEYYKVDPNYRRKPYACHHNDACVCEKRECYKCGWNPKVSKMRLEKYLQKGTLSNG